MLNVYLAQFNITYGHTDRESIYVPYSVGSVWHHAQQDPMVRDHSRLAGWFTHKQDPQWIAQHMCEPAVFAASVYMWNVQYTLSVCREIKQQHPACITVMGGPSVPSPADQWLEDHPWVDVVVHGEGEQAFVNVMRDIVSGSITTDQHRVARMRSLAEVSSPYAGGVFDQWINGINRDHTAINAVLETNRGCPYGCTFCDWGSATLGKVACFTRQRITEDIEWMGRNHIEWVFVADANFGAFRERDAWVVDELIRAKSQWGYPLQCKMSWHKNPTDHVIDMADRLIRHGMLKEYTVSLQSQHPEVLHNIRRRNITDQHIQRMQQLAEQRGFALYSELIAPLPGETRDSMINTMQSLIEQGIQFSVFPLQILPNAEMADAHYREQHGLVTRCLPLPEAHAWVKEIEETVIATNTMHQDDFEWVMLVAYAVESLHSTGFIHVVTEFMHRTHQVRHTDFVMALLTHFSDRDDTVIHGCFQDVWHHVSRGTTNRTYAGVWNVPMYTDLCTRHRDQFYEELSEFVHTQWPHCEHVADVIALQSHSQIHTRQAHHITITLASNLYDYVINDQEWVLQPHTHEITSSGISSDFISQGHFLNYSKQTGRWRTNITCRSVTI